MPTHHHFRLVISPDQDAPDLLISPRKQRRRHLISAEGKATIEGSAATAFHGEAPRWNPEELLIASLAQCHLLSLLYVLDRDGIDLVTYRVDAEGTLELDEHGEGRISVVTIRPRTEVAAGLANKVRLAHDEAHQLCFIARSVSCEVRVEPEIVEVSPPDTQL